MLEGFVIEMEEFAAAQHGEPPGDLDARRREMWFEDSLEADVRREHSLERKRSAENDNQRAAELRERYSDLPTEE